MEFEDIRTESIVDSLLTVVDRLIDLATDRSHGESIVVSANMITKGVANIVLSSEQVKKLGRNRVERWQDYLSTEAAHAKSGMSIGGCTQTFGHPMVSMAVRTLHIHSSQIMDRPIWTERTTGRREMDLRCR